MSKWWKMQVCRGYALVFCVKMNDTFFLKLHKNCKLNIAGKITCICPPGYMGPNCQLMVQSCTQTPCHPGSVCVAIGGFYKCMCQPGYEGPMCFTYVVLKIDTVFKQSSVMLHTKIILTKKIATISRKVLMKTLK